MFLISSCSCLCPIYWSQLLSRKWRCSWRSADRQCSNYIWVINNFITYKGVLILEVWWYFCYSSANLDSSFSGIHRGFCQMNFGFPVFLNSLWPGDAIWRQRSGSTLAQAMACCLMAASHYLNQCWLIISKVLYIIHLRTLSKEAMKVPISKASLKTEFLKLHPNPLRGQWVNVAKIWHAICWPLLGLLCWYPLVLIKSLTCVWW